MNTEHGYRIYARTRIMDLCERRRGDARENGTYNSTAEVAVDLALNELIAELAAPAEVKRLNAQILELTELNKRIKQEANEVNIVNARLSAEVTRLRNETADKKPK